MTFNYPTRALKVMDDFSLKIPAGGKIALVGHSGCGKSTLTNILLRFYNIEQGQVLIDGEDLDNYNVLALREQCGYVMQEPVLFNTTIKKNILFGKPDATDEEVYIAAQKANAIEFIEDTTTESLTDAEKKERLDNQLKAAFEELGSKNAPAIVQLQADFADSSKLVKQTLVDLLKNSSIEFLAQANGDPEGFKKAIEGAMEKYGASWEDIVIRFEWRQELDDIFSMFSNSDPMFRCVTTLLSQHPDLYASFSKLSIEKANSQGITDPDQLAQLIRDDLSLYR